jgi:hypothetical protein
VVATTKNIATTKKRVQSTQQTRPAYDGQPRPRLVDSYVVRRPHK